MFKVKHNIVRIELQYSKSKEVNTNVNIEMYTLAIYSYHLITPETFELIIFFQFNRDWAAVV